MKLQFKHQAFQADAANAVCDVFAGQPFRTPTYMIDSGFGQVSMYQMEDFTGGQMCFLHICKNYMERFPRSPS